MNSRLFLTILSIIYVLKINSQTVEPSVGIEKSILQLEFETLYSIEKAGAQKNTSWSIPNILVRYGLTDNIELQLHTPFTKQICYENNELLRNVFEFNEIELGLSVNLWKQNELLPEAAIMARVISSTNELNIYKIGNLISLNFSNIISEKIVLNYNIGTSTDIYKRTSGFYIVNISYEPSTKMHFFIENSSDFTFKNTESNCLRTGLGFNLNNNLALDFSLAKSLKHNLFSTGVILTWVINT